MIDYSKLSNEDLIKLNNNDYSGISDEGLKIIYADNASSDDGEPLQNIQLSEDGSLQQPLQVSVSKFDLRPSHLADEAAKRLVALPIAGYNAIKNRSFKGAYSQALNDLDMAKQKMYELDPTGKKFEDVGNAVFDIGAVIALPEANLFKGAGLGARVGNSALTNAYQGGLIGGIESLRNEGNLSGVGTGAAFGGTLGTAFPLVGAGISKLLPSAGASIAGVSPETIKQAIRPNSQALDLNPDTAQALLYDTTQNVRNAYNNLLSKRGQAVNEAVENLRGNQYRIPVEDLQSDITQTFDQYGGELINPARNMTGSLEQDLLDLIDSGKPVVDINTEVLPKFNGDKNLYNKELRNLYKQNVKGKTIQHPERGEIYFPKNGAGETINKVGNDFEQLSLLPQIDEITQKAKFQNPENIIPGKPNRMKAKDFDILKGRANLGNQTIDTSIKIANTPQGKMFYLNEKPLRSQDFIPNMEPGLGANNIINDNEQYFNTISPIDLEKTKQQIGNMVNWQDETARNYRNPILEQIYGKYNSRLSNLSPELQAANENFANLRNFKNNEGLRRVLRAGDNIDSASSALKNYNSTVTKGNTGRNIQDLENILVSNGSEPFLNTIDDINAAMDLSKSIGTGRNFGGVTDIAKSLLVEPALRGARAMNKTGIPQQLNVLRENVPLSTVQMLYGLTRPFNQ